MHIRTKIHPRQINTRILSAMILALLFCLETQAQKTLSGKITEAGGNNLSGVTIYIPELKRVSISDSNGQFTFDNLPALPLQLEFTAIGYRTVVKTVNVSLASQLNIQLETSATELEEVLITSNSSQLPDNIPFSAYTIPQNDINKYKSPSLMHNLSYQPGVDMISIGNGIGKPVIRGLSFNQVLLYAQGTRIENQQWDDHHDLGITSMGLQNVEVVKGPAALIYGPDALGGALIFTDEKPVKQGSTAADANIGFATNTLGLMADAGMRSTRKNGFFYGIRAGGESHTSYLQGESDDVNSEEEEFAPNSKMQNVAVKGNAGLSRQWGVSKFSYSLFHQQIGIIEDESMDTVRAGGEEEQREREMEAPYQDVSSHIFSFENTFLKKNSRIDFNASYQLNIRKEYEPLPGKQKELAIGLLLNTITYDLKWSSTNRKYFSTTIGTQGLVSRNRNNGNESLVPDADVNNFSVYTLVKYDREKLNVLAGARVDYRTIEAEKFETTEENQFVLYHNGVSDTVNEPELELEKQYIPVSFSAGLCFHPDDNLTLKFNGVTGFTAPNYAQLGTFGKHEGTYRFEQGNKDLRIEQNFEADAGAIWENRNVTIDLSAYYNYIYDYIYPLRAGSSMQIIHPGSTETLPVYEFRQDDARIMGLETGFDIHPPGLKWLDFKSSYALIYGELINGGYLPSIPSNKLICELKFLKASLGKLKENYFSIIISNYAKQTHLTQFDLASDGYTLLDLHTGTTLIFGRQNIQVELYCTNVLNTAYFNQLSLIKSIGVRDMGRNIGLRIHIPFVSDREK